MKSELTISEVMNSSARLLNENKIADARLNVEMMLCEILNYDRIKLYLNFDRPLNGNELERFDSMLQRRLKSEPLQYILGKAPFYGREFIVNGKVLIPRPDTEILVEKVLEDIAKNEIRHPKIFEAGCGSGCISISIAGELTLKEIDCEIFAIDDSAEAIQISNQNKKAILNDKTNIVFYLKNLFEIEKLKRHFDYLIANPPYIALKDIAYLDKEVRDYEPMSSLTDFGSGMKFYEKIFGLASEESFSGKVFCEIGFGMRKSIENLLSERGFKDFMFHKDLAGIDRVLELSK